MLRAAFILGGLAVGFGAILPAAAAERASVPAHAEIVEPATVRVNWALATPSVKGVASGAAFQGNMPSISLGLLMPANARLTVRREDETGQPVTAPSLFEVVTEGGRDLILRTGGTAGFMSADGGALAGGSLLGGAAASIEVGRGLSLVANGPQPTTLLVMVQYN